MKRILVTTAIAIVALSVLAYAKGSTTVKLVVTGGSLAKPLEITDPRVLGSGGFFGFLGSVGGPTDFQANRPQYAISFFDRLRTNEVRKVFTLFYQPCTECDGGVLYIPGRADPEYRENRSTLASPSDGETGKWLVAPRAWSDLIKAAIDVAEKK